jgi:hypothetical protein
MNRQYSVLSNPAILFDGAIANYTFVRLVRDGVGKIKNQDDLILEGYFNDLYKFFLRKLAEFDCISHCDQKSKDTLKGILDELIKVKGMLSEKKQD